MPPKATPAATQKPGKKGNEALPALCTKMSDQEKACWKNAELLEAVIGDWMDQNGSTYTVQLDSGWEQNSCSVFTTRPCGKTRMTPGLIHVRREEVCWGGGFTLDRARAAYEEICWKPRKAGFSKSFKWARKVEEPNWWQPCVDVASLRMAQNLQMPKKGEKLSERLAITNGQEQLAIEDGANQLAIEDVAYQEDESDDEDIAAEPHQWNYEKRPIPVEDIRWSQDTIGIRFRDGRLLYDTLQDMLDGKVKTDLLPTFRVVLFEDILYAVTGNRRLWVLKAYQRLSGQQVRVVAECHPPAAMQTNWCRRRYSTTSQGESVRFICKSFGDVMYAEMQEALWAANLRKQAQKLTQLETKIADEKEAEANRAAAAAQAQAKAVWQLSATNELEEEYCFCSGPSDDKPAQHRGQVGSAPVDDDTATTGIPQEGEQETPTEVFPPTDDEEEVVDSVARQALNSLLGIVTDQGPNRYTPMGLQLAAQQLLAAPASLGSSAYPSSLTPEGWVDCSPEAWPDVAPEDMQYDFPGYFQPDWSLVSQAWQHEEPAAAAQQPSDQRPRHMEVTQLHVWQMHLAGQLAQLGFLVDPSQVSDGQRAGNQEQPQKGSEPPASRRIHRI